MTEVAAPAAGARAQGQEAAPLSPQSIRLAVKLYTGLADWWHLISPPAEYTGEAAFIAQVIADACKISAAPGARTRIGRR